MDWLIQRDHNWLRLRPSYLTTRLNLLSYELSPFDDLLRPYHAADVEYAARRWVWQMAGFLIT